MKRYLPPRRSMVLSQPTLFRMTPDEFVASTRVSFDEMKIWNKRGWLSFDPDSLDEYDERERLEVLFIKAVARSGMSHAKVNNLLFGLEKPFCYDPEETFYSFAKDSWVTLPRDAMNGIARGKMERFVSNEVWDELENELIYQRGR